MFNNIVRCRHDKLWLLHCQIILGPREKKINNIKIIVIIKTGFDLLPLNRLLFLQQKL
jgi:hypothetical protein